MSVIILFAMSNNLNSQLKYVGTPTRPVIDSVHGFEITDPYRWLENKDDPEVKEWSHKQHQFTLDYIQSHEKEIPGLKDEIKTYLNRDYRSAPIYAGMREFFYARSKGEQQNKLYTILDGKEILIFDPVQIDPSGKSAISATSFTKDGNRLAVGIQTKGDEINEFRIIDTKNGKVLGPVIKNLNGFSWTKDEKHAYITVRTKEMIANQVPLQTYLHKIGDDHKNDVFLVAPKDAKDFASVWDTRDGGVTFFNEGDFYSSTLKIRKAGTMEEPKGIYSSKKYTAQPNVKGNKIYFYTNYEAPNFKIMIASIEKPEFENWTTFYPEKETVLESYEITSDYAIILDKKDVLSRLNVYDLDGKFVRELSLPEPGNVSSISYHEETNTVFVNLNTYNSPTKVYKLDGKTLKWSFFYQDKPYINTESIDWKQVFYISRDGTKIPMFIVFKKGIKLDGTNPTLLYGYGGFNISMEPSFIGLTAAFINRGGIYAVANIRGGNEYGENWHLNGMLEKKQNTFDDFISAAEYLIKEGYTKPEKLAIEGGSNGGLLVGAVMTQRPDLFKAVVCSVPLLDMLRYHKFLIARYWIPEYGDPYKKEDFLNILKYSPYQNIRPGFNYPTVLIKAGENDTRVDPLHAKKFAAALQNNPGQFNPVLLFINFESGHGSGQSIDQMVDTISLQWRFIMGELGMN